MVAVAIAIAVADMVGFVLTIKKLLLGGQGWVCIGDAGSLVVGVSEEVLSSSQRVQIRHGFWPYMVGAPITIWTGIVQLSQGSGSASCRKQ